MNQQPDFNVSISQKDKIIKNYSNGSNRNEQSTEGAAQNERGNQKRFSMADTVEESDKLVAVHNKSLSGLKRMLQRNGVPFPSIAIKKAGSGHEGFGEVSIVFPKSTIDPERNTWNRLYSNDAWTPTEPRIEYDVGDTYKYQKLFENMLGSDIYHALKGSSHLSSSELERKLESNNGNIFDAVKQIGIVKYGYLQSIGQRPEVGTKAITLDAFGRYKNNQLLAVFESIDGETLRNATYDDTEVRQKIADVLNEQFIQKLPEDKRDAVLKMYRTKPTYTADKINIRIIQDAYEKWKSAGRTIPTEIDTSSLEMDLRNNRALEENADYQRWVEDIFDGLIKDSGIFNGKDYYTPSGNRRSFQQLHVPATLENIVAQMRKESETGIGGLGGINLRGAATKTYNTVEDMRQDIDKLIGTHISDDVYDGYMKGFYARLSDMVDRAAKGSDWNYRDTAENVLLEAVRDAKTKASMNAMLRKEAQFINYNNSLADDLWQLKMDVQNMPAPYFEAKPRRVVTPDEAIAYILPDTADNVILGELKKRGLTVLVYEAGNEQDRLKKLNSIESARFSRADVDERDFAQRLAESERARKKLEHGMVQAQKTIERLRRETKASKTKTANPQDVRKFARDILKSYPYTSVKAADIYDRVQQIADGFMRETDTGELYKIALDVATEIIDNSYVRLSDDGDILGLNEGYTFADEIRGYLKGQKTVYINRRDADDAAAQLGFDSYRALRNEMRKYGLTLSTTSSNISNSVDSMYSELNSMYPGWFPTETNVAAEINNIRRAVSEEEFNPYYDRKRSELAHLDIDFVSALANEIFEGAIGEEVRQYYSAVDKAAAREKARQSKAAKIVEKKNIKIEELRQKRNDDLAALRKADKAKLDALRAEKNKRIAQIKAEGTAQRIELVRWYKERRQKAELRDKIFKLKTKADQMTIRSTKTAHVPPNLMRPVSEMCSILTSAAARNVDSRQTRLDKRLADAGIETAAYEEKSERLKITQAKLNELQKAYERISSDEEYNYVFDEAINKMLNELSTMLAGTHLYAGDFSVEDLSRVYEIMSAVMYSVENANKASALETDENLKEFVSRFSNDIDNASAMSGLMSKLESTMLWQLRPDTFFNYICGYAKDNAGQDVQKMFVQGTERKLTVQREFYKMFRNITETNNAEWKKKYRQMTNNPIKELVEWGLKDENGNSVATSRGMMLQAYMLLNQEDSFKSLRIGGFRLANMKEYYHGNISEAYGIGSVLSENLVRQYGDVASEIRALRESMNDENADTVEAQIEEKLEIANDILLQAETNLYGLIDQIEKQLTDFDRAVLEAAREWYDYSGKKLDEINLEMYGFKKPRPKNYTPIHRDTTSVMSVDIRSMQDTVNLENLGSTKQRVRSTAPILLTDIFYELDSNQKKMSNFFGFVKVQNDFNKIYKMKAKRGGQSIEGKIARKFGSGTKSFTVTGTQYVENYIRSVAGGAAETSVLGGLFGNAAQATLTLNPRVAVSQLASIPTAAAVVGWDNMLKGFFRGMKTSFSKSGKEQLAETSVWFWQRYRGTGGITEVADMKANRGNVVSRTWNQIAATKVGGALLNWCQDMDVLATASMYAMAEEKAKKIGIDITSYAGKKRVNEIYTEIIRKTQPNYTATERSDMLRDHRDSLKILTMYKTQSNQNLNILIEASGEFNRAKRDFKRGAATNADVSAARAKLANASTAVVLGGTVAFAGLRFLANLVLGTLSNYRDDDEELTKESIIKGLAKDIGSSLSGMFALSGNLYDAFYSAFSGEKYYGLSDTAISNIGTVLSNTVTLVNKAMDEDRDIELKDIDKEISSLCNIIGIPYGNSKKIIDGVKMWYNDIQNGTFGQFEGNVERTDSQNINRFLHAYVDGDTEKMDSVFAEMLGNGDWHRKKELEGKFKSKAFKMFVEERTIDADSVKQLLMDYSGFADYQAEALVNEWQGIIDYGFDSSEASDAYVNGEMSVEEYSIYLSTVKGYDADKISSEIKNLDCKRDTGMAYNELHDAYMYDAVSSSEAKKLINKYSNDDTDADPLIARWDFEKQTGYTWSNVHRAFKANKVSEAELKNYYQRVYGDSEEEAAVYVEIAKWKRDVPGAENFTKGQYNNYIQGQIYLEAANVSKSMFAEVAYAYHNDPELKSDKDENGNVITNSKLKKVMAYIDNLNISADQKTALALSFYKSKSNVNKYKHW